MKTNEIIKTLYQRDKKLIIIVSILLILFNLSNVFTNAALEFLRSVSDEMFLSLGVALELKSVAVSIESSNIPFASGLSMELADVFDKAINYLTFTNIMVATQILLVKLSKSLLFKMLPIVLFAGVFWEKYSAIFIKFLIVSFLLNPGLSIYVNSIDFVASNMEISIGSSLEKKLSSTHDKFEKEKEDLNKKQAERKRSQLIKAEKKGKKKLSILTKIEDFVLDKVENAGVAIKEDFAQAYIILKESKTEILDLAVNMISNTIFLFILLPLLYFYLMNMVLKKFFHFSGFNINQFGLNSLKNNLEKEVK